MKERGVRGAQDPGHGLVVDEHGAAVAALYDVLHDCQRVGGVVPAQMLQKYSGGRVLQYVHRESMRGA